MTTRKKTTTTPTTTMTMPTSPLTKADENYDGLKFENFKILNFRKLEEFWRHQELAKPEWIRKGFTTKFWRPNFLWVVKSLLHNAGVCGAGATPVKCLEGSSGAAGGLLISAVEQQCFPYIILLLAEVTAACASRLGNMLTLVHLGALAFVKSWPRNPGCSQQQRPNLKHSQKRDLINNNGHLKSSHSGGGSFKRVNNNNKKRVNDRGGT